MTSSHRLGLPARRVTRLLSSHQLVALMLAAALLPAGTAFGRLQPAAQEARAAPRPAAQARYDESSPKGTKQGAASVAGALNEDGSLRPGVSGSFDTKGFRMGLSPGGAPRFVAEAACSGWDTQFATNGVNGTVNALAVMGTDVYVGGSFTATSDGAANNVARFDTTTNTWSKLGTDGNGVYGTVNALAVSGSALYVGGQFLLATAGGTAVTHNVAKFDTATNTWSKLGTDGSGVDSYSSRFFRYTGAVSALAVIGSDLYVGGGFSQANYGGTAVAVNNLAKFDTATNTWSKLGTDGNGVNGGVGALEVIGSTLYVGGFFTQANYGGTAVAANHVARFDTTSNTWSKLGSNGNGVGGVGGTVFVSTLAVIGSGLYVGGGFAQANVGGTAVAANNIARFDTTTNTWSKLGSDGNGVSGFVIAMAVVGGDLYVGGYLTQANVGGTAVAVNHVAKFNTTTGIWSKLGADGDGVNDRVNALAVIGSGLYVGGGFSQANSGSTAISANFVAKFDATTSTWTKLAVKVGNGVSDVVRALAVIGTDVYVGGDFTAVGSVAANRVARFDTATNTWSKLGSDGNGVNHEVRALAVIGSGLYVGGFFTQANYGGTAVAANHVARFDTTSNTWSKLGSDGNGVSGYVIAMAVSGSGLYVGGIFGLTNYGGTAVAVNHVARFDTATNTWSKLGTDGNGVNGTVDALAVVGGTLYVGGGFSQANVGGTAVAANNIARFDTATNTWSKLGSDGNGVFGTVLAMAVVGGDLYVGGYLTQANVGGTAVAVNHVAKFDTTSNTWSKLGTDGVYGVNGTVSVYALVVSGDSLYVGGIFQQANVGGTAIAANHVARFDTATGTWSRLGTDGNGVYGADGIVSVYALAVIGSSLFVGGDFSLAGDDKPSQYIARFCDAARTFEFTRSPYAVAERGGSLAVTVRRTGDLSLPVSVYYSTDDGSSPSVAAPCSATAGQALERCDYARAAGTLRFAAGEAEKTFVVLVNDDSYVEGTETARLRLSNPSDGAVFGTLSSATLEITDDATESAGNPIDDARDFVSQHYRDFLGREPDAEGLAHWADQMTNCGSPNLEVCRVNVSAAFFLSIESQQTGYFVERTYKAAFGDAAGNSTLGGAHQLSVPVVRLDEFLPDAQEVGRDVVVGRDDWQRQLESNKQAFALEFVRRPKFLARYPALTAAAPFVNSLDANAGGVLTPDERSALVRELSPNPSDAALRASVLRKVAEDADLVRGETARAFVLMQYFGYLRRDPDAAPDADHTGYEFWLRKLDGFGGDFIRAEMVKAFISSGEYRQRFGQ